MQKLSSIRPTGESQNCRGVQTVLEVSPPLNTFSVFNIPFPCRIPCIVVVPFSGSSGSKLSLIPACLLGAQQRVSHRILLYNWVMDHISSHLSKPQGQGLRCRNLIDSESSIFRRQCNHHASWETTMNICWQRPAHLLAPSSLTCLTLAGMPPQPYLWAQPGP